MYLCRLLKMGLLLGFNHFLHSCIHTFIRVHWCQPLCATLHTVCDVDVCDATAPVSSNYPPGSTASHCWIAFKVIVIAGDIVTITLQHAKCMHVTAIPHHVLHVSSLRVTARNSPAPESDSFPLSAQVIESTDCHLSIEGTHRPRMSCLWELCTFCIWKSSKSMNLDNARAGPHNSRW